MDRDELLARMLATSVSDRPLADWPEVLSDYAQSLAALKEKLSPREIEALVRAGARDRVALRDRGVVDMHQQVAGGEDREGIGEDGLHAVAGILDAGGDVADLEERRVVILAADGPHFSSGHDLRDGSKMRDFEPVSCWGGYNLPGTDLWVGDYTIQPENGGVGVFAHEFGHQLSLSHEGDSTPPWCPLYPSLMNYAFSYSLGGDGNAIRFSDGRFAGVSLEESKLVERLPFAYADLKYLEAPPFRFPLKEDGANATMIDSDNVLLLHPPPGTRGFSFKNATRPRLGSLSKQNGFVAATINYFDKPVTPEFTTYFENTIKPVTLKAGACTLAYFITEDSPNTFPQLPVREGEHAFVWFAGFPDSEAFKTYLTRLRESQLWTAEIEPLLSKTLQGKPEVLRLTPTPRSWLTGIP